MSVKIHPVAMIMIPLLTAIGLFLSLHLSDPYWLKRFGALIATMSGGLVVWELWLEGKVDQSLSASTADHERSGAFSSGHSIQDKLMVRIRNARISAAKKEKFEQKEKFTLGHVFGACFGELLHGWGDLFISWGCSFFKLVV